MITDFVKKAIHSEFGFQNAGFLANGIEGIFLRIKKRKIGFQNAVFLGYRSEGTPTDNYEPNVNPELFLKFVCENTIFFGYRSEGTNEMEGAKGNKQRRLKRCKIYDTLY